MMAWPTFGLATEKPLYVIAHMANTEAAVDWAVAHGANGVETDLRFSDAGKPVKFLHGGICDCFCAFGQESICSVLRRGGAACQASTTPDRLLSRISQKTEIALLVIDSKVSDLSSTAKEAAGREVISLLKDRLFGASYSGNVVISAAKMEYIEYMRAAAGAVQGNTFADKVFFSFDEEGNKAAQVLTALRDLPSRARAFGTGISACAWGHFRRGIKVADQNASNGSASFAYIWTLDRASSMKRYINAGAQGVITNYPAKLRNVVLSDGRRLATRATLLPLSTSDEIIDARN
jgi:hypothetical protein